VTRIAARLKCGECRGGQERDGAGQKVQDLYQTIFEVIDFKSFSNLWFWIGLAVIWSTVSHWIIGVPYDMLVRARRHGGQAEIDFEEMVRINVNRLSLIGRISGLWLLGAGAAAVTSLGILGFIYGVEFAQAVFLIALPLCIVAVMSFRTATRIRQEAPRGEALKSVLLGLRIRIQLVGVAALATTAFWGMYQNLAVGALRHL
jgi:hypothetical protein